MDWKRGGLRARIIRDAIVQLIVARKLTVNAMLSPNTIR